MYQENQGSTSNPLDAFLEESADASAPTAESAGDFDPFAEAENASAEESPEQPAAKPETQPAKTQTQSGPAGGAEQMNLVPAGNPDGENEASKPEPPADPFAAALAKAESDSNKRMAEALALKPPVFSYAGVKDSITDPEKTFEQLREQYEPDFPELSEKKKVSWTMSYGKATRYISKPELEKVYAVKADIEKSRPFLDGLKNARKDADKNPECTVTPKVTAQSKGEGIPAYKGEYPSLEAALQNPKPIMLIPNRRGVKHEVRCTGIGTFVTLADPHSAGDSFLESPAGDPENDGPDVTPGFLFHLPKIPYNTLAAVLDLFRYYAGQRLEVLAHILYSPENGSYVIRVPEQRVSAGRVEVTRAEDIPEGLIHVMDIHSHHEMPAKFSGVDDNDEKATGLYAVIGRLHYLFPQISVRIANGGKFLEIEPRTVFENAPNPKICAHWKSAVTPLKKEGGGT